VHVVLLRCLRGRQVWLELCVLLQGLGLCCRRGRQTGRGMCGCSYPGSSLICLAGSCCMWWCVCCMLCKPDLPAFPAGVTLMLLVLKGAARGLRHPVGCAASLLQTCVVGSVSGNGDCAWTGACIVCSFLEFGLLLLCIAGRGTSCMQVYGCECCVYKQQLLLAACSGRCMVCVCVDPNPGSFYVLLLVCLACSSLHMCMHP
jgi:hypothetical protein